MPVISEFELNQQPQPCFMCDKYEGAIWICGDGFICESDFSALSGLSEADSMEEEIPDSARARLRSALNHKRGNNGTL